MTKQKRERKRGNLPCEPEVSVDSRHQNWLYNNKNTKKEVYCTFHSNSYKKYNGWLVRKSFQLKEFQYSTAAVGNFNTAAKRKTLQQVYKSLGWILMHLNSVPSWKPEQGHVCSSVRMDNTVFPSAPQAQQLDLMTATQFSRWTSLKKN